MKRLPIVVAVAFFALALAPEVAPETAGAQEVTTIRLATLAPRGSAWERGFARWNRELTERTGGRLRIQVYAGGSAGDERTVVRKMREGQMDAAVLTTTGLGMIARPVLVLSAPGVIETYEQLDAVRAELAPELEQAISDNGFTLLGWGDAGRVRLFSKRRIERPADLAAARPWVWRDNPVFVEVLRSAGVNGVAISVPEVLAGLSTGRVDTVPASALAAVALQWYTQVRYVSATASGVIVGAMVVRKDVVDGLPPDVRDVLVESARASSRRSEALVRRFDDRAYDAILARGLTPVDAEAHRPEWEAIGERARARLVNRLYTAEMLRRVEEIAARHPRRPAAAGRRR
jgi:TRAP-type C4-dicarboxylate transport system substrate-binding protein